MYIYEEIANSIKRDIRENKIKKEIPSERDLSLRYSASRGTIRKALERLKSETLIYSKLGSGYYVNEKSIPQHLNRIYSLTEDMSKISFQLKTRILEFKKVYPSELIQKKMKLHSQEKVFYIKRLRVIEDSPCILEENYLLPKVFPVINRKELEDTSLYGYLNDNYKFEFTESYEEFSASISTSEIMELFDSAEPEAVIDIERFSYIKDEVVEYTRGVVKGDKFKYMVKLK